MKYRIIEEIDGVGCSVFYAQYETKTLFGKKWEMVYDHFLFSDKRFISTREALQYLKKYVAPKTSNIVQEGDL